MTHPKDTPATEKTVPEEFDAICDATSGNTDEKGRPMTYWGGKTSGSADQAVRDSGYWLHETEDAQKAATVVWDAMQYGKMPPQHEVMILISAANKGIQAAEQAAELRERNAELEKIVTPNALRQHDLDKENESLRQRVTVLEGALERISRMSTLPDKICNTYTLAAARLIAKEALDQSRSGEKV